MKKLNSISLALMTVVCWCLFSCSSSSEDDSIDTTPITMYAGSDKTIEGADTISSLNKFVAYGSKNKIHGWHVGETTVTVNGKKNIQVTIAPKYNLYADPICEWGCSMDHVKKNQKQGSLNPKSTDAILAYNDAGGASLLAYYFKNGTLASVMAIVSSNHTSVLADYLSERYLILPYYQGKETYFAGIDGLDENHAKTMVLMQLRNVNEWDVYYAPYTNNSTRSIENNKEKEKCIDALRSFLID
ncbi:MAG: hypothetical protein J6M36_01570 [Prevotella sp.]|nr:hypothetical protein [Prevotella sp.]